MQTTGKLYVFTSGKIVSTARKPFCKFDRSFLVTGSTTILGTESISVFTNEKIFQEVGKLLLQKII